MNRIFRLTLLALPALMVQAAPHVLINAAHYPALKDSLLPGDAAFAFAIRDPDGPPRQVNGMRTFNTVWNEAKFRHAVDALNAIDDPRVEKQVVFSSIEDLKANIARLPKNVHWIGYNMEPAMTPADEMTAVDQSVAAFGKYCHEHSLKLNWVPGGFRIFDNDQRLAAILPSVDAVVLQLQRQLQNEGVESFVKVAREWAARIKRINPRVEVNVQVVIGRGSKEDVVRALRAVSADVDRETLWTMTDTAAVREVLAAVRPQ